MGALRQHWRYLLIEQGLGAGVFNVAFNAAIAWASFKSLAVVPLWGTLSIAADVVATAFLLPFMTTLVVTALARRDLRRGRLSHLVGDRYLGWLPGSPATRGALLGGACSVLVVPPTLIALHVLHVDALAFTRFLVFKALFAGALALVVTPFIAYAALDDRRTAA